MSLCHNKLSFLSSWLFFSSLSGYAQTNEVLNGDFGGFGTPNLKYWTAQGVPQSPPAVSGGPYGSNVPLIVTNPGEFKEVSQSVQLPIPGLYQLSYAYRNVFAGGSTSFDWTVHAGPYQTQATIPSSSATPDYLNFTTDVLVTSVKDPVLLSFTVNNPVGGAGGIFFTHVSFSELNQTDLNSAKSSNAMTYACNFSSQVTITSVNKLLWFMDISQETFDPRKKTVKDLASSSNDLDSNQPFDESDLVSGRDLSWSRKAKHQDPKSSFQGKNVHVWGRALGQYIHHNQNHKKSAFSVGSGGALVGSDWIFNQHAIGFAGSYVYSYLGQSHHQGHANVNQGSLIPYAVLKYDHWSIDLSLLGGYCHNDVHRHFKNSSIEYNATASSHAWQISPHFGVSYGKIFKDSWFDIEPYLMADYVASWQSSFTERGGSLYNATQKGFFSGFVRTESGLTFNEKIAISYGDLILKERGAWAYQRTFGMASNLVSLVGLQQSFAVTNFPHVQNLAVIQFGMAFIPKKVKLPVIEVTYEGQYGSVFMLQLGTINISKNF